MPNNFADREAARAARAADRADRYSTYAHNAGDRATAAADRSNDIAQRWAGGQPILTGHHSEERARRDRDRSDAAIRRSIREEKKAEYWERRADRAERRQEQRTDPRVTARRIERLEAERRRIVRGLDEPGDDERRERLSERLAEVDEQLTYWRSLVAEAEAAGVKMYGPGDFQKGDYAFRRGTWWEIKRVNKKTITVGAIIGSAGRKVYRLSDNPYPWTDTIPYTEIKGRKTAEEIPTE